MDDHLPPPGDTTEPAPPPDWPAAPGAWPQEPPSTGGPQVPPPPGGYGAAPAPGGGGFVPPYHTYWPPAAPPYWQPAAVPYAHTQGAGRVANPWMRVLARCIDWVALVTATLVTVILVFVAVDPYDDAAGGAFFAAGVAVPAIWALYNVVPVALWGATPGKAICGMRVVSDEPGLPRIGWSAALARHAVPLALDAFALLPVIGDFAWLAQWGALLVSAIMLFADDRHRALGDRLARTVVVTTR